MRFLGKEFRLLSNTNQRGLSLKDSDINDVLNDPVIKSLTIVAGILILSLGVLASQQATTNRGVTGHSTNTDSSSAISESEATNKLMQTEEPLQVKIDSSDSTKKSLIVNGQDIAIPENGSVNTSVPSQSGEGSAEVSASSSNSSTAEGGTTRESSRLNVKIKSSGDVNLKL